MKATIVSIYPLERRHFLPRHTKRNTYILPAAEPGTFIKDVVDDDDVMDYVGHGRNFPFRQPGEQIANALVDVWTGGQAFIGLAAGAKPGIAWLPGTPSDSEIIESGILNELRTAQHLFANSVVKYADWLESKERRHSINEIHHLMAKYLGLEGRAWQEAAMKREDMTQCWACQKMIPRNAAKCPFCQEVVDAELYARKQAELKKAIREAGKTAKPEPVVAA
jgi:hypothetical protein